MTREEAAEIIRDYDVNGCGYCHQGGDEVEEALEMAIKALEQEPCEDCSRINKPNPYYDCISRQNAIDAMWEELDEDTAHKVRDILELQPSVIPKQEPCEDAISRKEAKKAMEDKAKGLKNLDIINGLCGAVAILYDLPSVQPKPKTDVLDKIRAEIEEQKECRCFDDDDMCIYRTGLDDALYIIDKYKAESEETE